MTRNTDPTHGTNKRPVRPCSLHLYCWLEWLQNCKDNLNQSNLHIFFLLLLNSLTSSLLINQPTNQP
ncbi:hypothetical protein CR513_47834, partial [Mucuna pruriens]